MIKLSFSDELPGGLADKMKPMDFDHEQLMKGVKVEMEHTNDPKLALEIAMDHLAEDPKYYDKLEFIEQHAEDGSNNDKLGNMYKELLACTRALAMVAQSFHWRTKGRNYYGDHLLFERIYNDVNAMIDETAEKGIGVSGDADLAEVNTQADLTAEFVHKHAEKDLKEEDFPRSLLKYTEAHLELLRDMLDQLEKSGDLTDGVEDQLQGFANKHEEHAYLLKQRVEEDEVSKESNFIQALSKIAGELDAVKEYALANRIDDIIRQAACPGMDYDEEQMVEDKNNPWAICTESVGRENEEKYERCVKQVKEQYDAQDGKPDYKEFVREKLNSGKWAQYGVSSPFELPQVEQKAFFAELEKEWNERTGEPTKYAE